MRKHFKPCMNFNTCFLYCRVVVEIRASAGFQLPLMQAGVALKAKVYAAIPLRLRATVDPTSKNIAIKYYLINTPTETVKVEIIPTTYINIFRPEPTTEVYATVAKVITNPRIVKPIIMKVFKSLYIFYWFKACTLNAIFICRCPIIWHIMALMLSTHWRYLHHWPHGPRTYL